jgi:hypothetical protein
MGLYFSPSDFPLSLFFNIIAYVVHFFCFIIIIYHIYFKRYRAKKSLFLKGNLGKFLDKDKHQ